MNRLAVINNILIQRASPPGTEVYQAVAPDGRVLEEFRDVVAAAKWAQETKDFLKYKDGKCQKR